MNARTTTLLAAACLLAACDGNDITVTIDTVSSSSQTSQSSEATTTSSRASSSAIAVLNSARSTWQAHHSANYSYDFYRDCFCYGLDDFRVYVQNGELIKTPINEETIPEAEGIDPSISALFALIEQANEDESLQSVTYNAVLGYPENVVIDPLPGAADTTIQYRIDNFQDIFTEIPPSSSSSPDTSSSYSTSSAPRTLSDAEKARRINQRDAAAREWALNKDRSYQYKLGDYGNCIVGHFNCGGVYDYTYTTYGVVKNGEATLGFGKSISQDFGSLFKSPQNLDNRADLSDAFVTNPAYTFNYSDHGVASWSYSFPNRFDDEYGRDELLSLEFFNELESLRQFEHNSWHITKPAGDFSYTLTVDCECDYAGTHRLLTHGDHTSATPLQAASPLPSESLYSIDALFELVAKTYANPTAYIDVTYHPELHFPTRITFNPTLARSASNISYSVSDFSDHPALNDATQALARWRTISQQSFEYRLQSKEFSVNTYYYALSASNGKHTIEQVFQESATPPIAADIEAIYRTLFEYSDARDIEFTADNLGVPTEVRIHPADKVMGDYLQYSISGFQFRSVSPSELTNQQALWQAHQISDYKMTLYLSCFCFPFGEIDVHVENGVLTSAYSHQLERLLTEEERQWHVFTIDGLFNEIADSIEHGSTTEVVFDEEFGYPKSLVVDREAQVVDAGYNLDIVKFDPTSQP